MREGMTSDTGAPEVTSFGWRSLGSAAALGLIALSVIGALLFGMDPFIVVFLVVFGVTFLLLRRRGKAGPIVLLVVSGLVLALIAPFSFSDLLHPESWRSFLLSLGMFVGAAIGVLAGIGTLARWKPRSAVSVGMVGIGVFGVGLLAAAAAATTVSNDEMVTGDLVVTASDVSFNPGTLSIPSGSIGIFIENEDPVRHTFTVKELGVDAELPAGKDRRVVLVASAGTYHVVCTVPGHESMSMTLAVEG